MRSARPERTSWNDCGRSNWRRPCCSARSLIDHVGRWAAGQGLPALTLSTFRAVPWNAPYYARLGFRELSPTEVTPGLADIQREETAMRLDPAERVLMRREIETLGVSG